MRVDAGNRDARPLVTDAFQMRVASADGCQHPLRRRPPNGLLQGDMGGNVNDLQPFGGEQHIGGRGAGETAQHAGVPVIMMTGEVQGFLVDRRGDDAADCTRFGIANRLFDKAERGVSGNRRQCTPGQRCALHGQVDHMLSEIDINAERIPRRFQRGEVAVNPRRRTIRGRHFCERPHRDLGSDAAGVAHGDANDVAHLCLPSFSLAQPGASRTYLIARR